MPIVQPRGARDYRGSVKGLEDIEIAFLSASEIAGELARGAVHFGVTGADLLNEQLADPASKSKCSRHSLWSRQCCGGCS